MENYEQKYKDALSWMKDLYPTFEGATKEDAEHYFPELKENEDERIRKEILEYFQQFENEELRGVNISDWLAWLEKQGEQKSNKVEPKSKEKTKFYDSMDDLIADALIEEIENSELDDSSKHNRIYWIKSHRQKSTWSEEDEQMLHEISQCVYDNVVNIGTVNKVKYIDWLKSLKERIKGE